MPRRDPWPQPGSITDAEVNRRIAAAVQSEHAAGSIARHDAVLAAVKAEREACAQLANTCWFGGSAARAIRNRYLKDML